MTASLVGNVSLLALAAAALIGCYAQSPVISRHETEPPREATAAPARWISVRGSSNEGVALPNGRLVLILGERALVDAAGNVTLAREPSPAPLFERVDPSGARRPWAVLPIPGSEPPTQLDEVEVDTLHAIVPTGAGSVSVRMRRGEAPVVKELAEGAVASARGRVVWAAEGGRLDGAVADLACTFGLP